MSKASVKPPNIQAESITAELRAYRELFNLAPIGMSVTDLKGKFLKVNAEYSRIMGYSRRELLGKSFLDITHAGDRKKNRILLSRLVKGEINSYVMDKRFIRKNGSISYCHVKTTCQRGRNGKPQKLIGQLVDLSAFKQAEEEVKAQQRFLYSIIDTNPHLVFVKDYNGEFRLVNKAVADIYKTTVTGIIGKTDADFNPNKEEVKNFLKADRAVMDSLHPKIIPEEPVTDQKTRQTNWFQTIKVPLVIGNKKHVLGVATNITGLKKAEMVKTACYRIAAAATSDISLDEFFQFIHVELNSILSTKNFYIAFYDKDKNFITFPYFIDENYLRSGYLPEGRRPGKGFTELVIRTKRPLFADEKAIRRLLKAGKVKTIGVRPKIWMGTPLITDHGVIGVIAVQSYGHETAYSSADLELLEFIASQIAGIIERKSAMEKARQAESYFKLVTEQMSEVVWTTDNDLVITAAIGAGLKSIGLRPEQLVGMHSYDFFHSRDPEYAPVKAHLSALKGKTTTYEMSISGLYFHCVIKPLKDNEGKIIGCIGVSVDITQKKLIEESLKEKETMHRSEKLFRQYLENVNLAAVSLDLKGNITFINDFMLKMTGWKSHQVIGKNWITTFVPGAERKLRKRRFRGFLKGEVDFRKPFEASVQTKSGSLRNVKWSVSLVFDHMGKAVGMTGIGEDITELKLTEEAMRLSDSVLNRISNLVLVADRTAKIIYVSPSINNILGYSQSEVYGTKWWEKFGHGEGKTLKAKLLKMVKEGSPATISYERLFKRKDGAPTWIKWITSVSADGLIIGVGHDITDEKQAADALLESEEKFRGIFNSIDDVYYRTGKKGKFAILSPSAEFVLGYRPKELLGKHAKSIYSNPSDYSLLEKSLLQDSKVSNFEAPLRNKRGTKIYAAINSKLIRDKDGHVLGSEGTIRDITKKKIAEYELIKAKQAAEELSRAKTAFLANMSHELRTPMNGILGMIDILSESSLQDEQKEYARIIRNSATNLSHLLGNLLDLSTLDSGKLNLKPTDSNLRSIVSETISLFHARAALKNIRLESSISSDVPQSAILDKERLFQVLSNLIDNAIKFTPSGTVGISLSAEFINGKINLKFKITDPGIGISKQDQERVFNKFVQVDASLDRQYKGAGLGLAICKELVKLMGGAISVSSRRNKGSIFSFNVLAGHSPAGKTRSRPADYVPLDGTVLLIEDDEVNLFVTAQMLRKAGLHVETARNGTEGFQKLVSSAFDLVIMDLHMPGKSGASLMEEIKSLDHEVPPVIVLSANVMEESKDAMFAAGVREYLTKPIDFQTLYSSLRNYLKPHPQKEFINEETIRNLRNMVGENYPALVNEFIAKTSLQLDEIRTALENRDLVSAAGKLHMIKGRLFTMGITPIAIQVQKAETAVNNNDVDACLILLNRLAGDFTRLKSAIRAI